MNDIDTRTEDYLRRVRAALADLPADEVAEVMEDLEPHVAEVFEEAGSAEEVERRLGTPEEYAAELRAAGGYPSAQASPVDKPRAWRARYVLLAAIAVTGGAAVSGLAALSWYDEDTLGPVFVTALAAIPALWLVFAGIVRRGDVEALPEYRKLREVGTRLVSGLPWAARLRDMRGAWWLVRLGLLALAFLGAIRAEGGFWLIAILAAAAVLVWAGARVATDRRLLLVVVPANALAIGLGVALAVQAVDPPSSGGSYYAVSGSSGLAYEGRELTTVFAVDAEGNHIPEFYLYDRNGIPLNVYQYGCDGDHRYTNQFPASRALAGEFGCEYDQDPPFIPRPPGAPTAPTTSAPAVTTAPTTAPTTTAPTTTRPTTTGPTTTGP